MHLSLTRNNDQNTGLSFFVTVPVSFSCVARKKFEKILRNLKKGIDIFKICGIIVTLPMRVGNKTEYAGLAELADA